MAIDLRHEWNGLLENLHNDALDQEMFEKNLPEVTEIVNELSQEKFKRFNGQNHDKILSLKKQINNINAMPKQDEVQKLRQEVEGIYSNCKRKSQQPQAAPSAPQPKSAQPQVKPVASTAIETSDKESEEETAPLLPKAEKPASAPKEMQQDEKEIDDMNSILIKDFGCVPAFGENKYKMRSEAEYQQLIENLLKVGSEDKIVQLKNMRTLLSEASAKLDNRDFPRTYKKLQELHTLTNCLRLTPDALFIRNHPEEYEPVSDEDLALVLERRDEIFHTFSTERSGQINFRTAEVDKKLITTVLDGHELLEDRLSRLERIIDALPDLSMFEVFNDKLATIKQQAETLKGNKKLLTVNSINDLTQKLDYFFNNAKEFVYDKNKDGSDPILNQISTKLRDLYLALIPLTIPASNDISELGLAFRLNENLYENEYPKIYQKIQKIKTDINNFLGESLGFFSADGTINANRNKFNNVNTDALFKALFELRDMIIKETALGMPSEVMSLILNKATFTDGGSEAEAELKRLETVSSEFSRGANVQNPQKVADALSRPPGPRPGELVERAKRAGNLLTDLYLGNYPITEEEINLLKKYCPNIRSINLSGSQEITDEQLLMLGDLWTVNTIDLRNCNKLTEKGITQLFSKHWGWKISLTQMSIPILKSLSYNNLESLHLEQVQLASEECDNFCYEFVRHIQSFQAFKKLNIANNHFRNEKDILNFLNIFTSLETVVLGDVLSPQGLEQLSVRCSNLKSITFMSGQVDERTLEAIDRLFPNLKELNLGPDVGIPANLQVGNRNTGNKEYIIKRV